MTSNPTSLDEIKISVIIPVYNEENTIAKVLETVKSTSIPNIEVIVVDDCSSDNTRALLQGDVRRLIDQLILKEKNEGKGAALRDGLAAATGDVLVIQDADLEYDPNEYTNLIRPILEGRADVVYGSRFCSSGPHRVVYFWHMLGNQFLTLLSNAFTNLNLTDMETCSKMFTRKVLDSLTIEENRFGFEPEFTAKVAKRGWRIYEIGIPYYGRTYSEGKKINWKDGFRAIYAILKYNLFRR
jgi:glycosyltransferase involved in cell wall biosynthesis